MQFMADVTMVCEECGGKRFKPDILEVRYKEKNISDILSMSVEEAIAFFGSQKEPIAKKISERLKVLDEVGATTNRIVVMNKCDLLGDKKLEENERQVLVSTKTGKGIEKLKNLIFDNLFVK